MARGRAKHTLRWWRKKERGAFFLFKLKRVIVIFKANLAVVFVVSHSMVEILVFLP